MSSSGYRDRLHATMPRTAPPHRVVILLLGLVGSAILTAATAVAAPPSHVALLRAGDGTIDCHFLHAGHEVGDGESTEGTILSATHISCRHALRIVRPRYREVLRIEADAASSTGSFRLGGFHCTWHLQGPDAIKRCIDHRRRFTFL